MSMSTLDKVRQALHITVQEYDGELADLIDAAKAELMIAGVKKYSDETDPLIRRAIVLYCRMHHNSPDDFDRLQKAWNILVSEMKHATGYTDWE